MNFKTVTLALASCGLFACSSNSPKQIDGDFEYADITEVKVISIPSGLKKPEHYTDFDIPGDVNTDGPVGEKVDIRAPSLALPIAAASRVEVNSSKAKIWFDQVFDDHDLAAFVHEAVEAQLLADEVALTKSGEKSYQSDWYREEIETGFWIFKSVDVTESRRYLIEYDAKPHGRSVSVEVTLIDFVKKDADGETKELDLIDKKRAEMSMLNSIVAQVDYQYRLKSKKDRVVRSQQQLVAVGENREAEPAYIVDIGIETLWDAMPFFYRDYAFNIDDLNETAYIYYVSFEKETSMFDFLWASDENLLDIADGKYQFTLEELGKNQTAVTIYDEVGEPLSNEVLTKLFPQMEKGLSFKTLF